MSEENQKKRSKDPFKYKKVIVKSRDVKRGETFKNVVDCTSAIRNYCQARFVTRIVASKCYDQLMAFFDGGKNPDTIKASKKMEEMKALMEKEPSVLYRFWGYEMEPKVKELLYYQFGLVILDSKTFTHPTDRTIVSRPDGIIVRGLDLVSKDESGNELCLPIARATLEIKCPYSNSVPNTIVPPVYLQKLQELICSGCEYGLLVYFTPSCFCVWSVKRDDHFWNEEVLPIIVEGKLDPKSFVSTNKKTTEEEEKRTMEKYEKEEDLEKIKRYLATINARDKEHFHQRLKRSVSENARITFMVYHDAIEEQWVVHGRKNRRLNQDGIVSKDQTLVEYAGALRFAKRDILISSIVKFCSSEYRQ